MSGPDAEGGYTLSATVAIAAPAAAIVPWLTQAEHLEQWMLGVDAAVQMEDDATQLRVITSSGVYAGWTFLGTTRVESPLRVVRTYVLEDLRTGGVSRPADMTGYERTVAFDLEPAPDGGTRMACSVATTIPRLDKTGAARAVKSEQKTLDRSLERLEMLVVGRPRGIFSALRGSRLAPAAF